MPVTNDEPLLQGRAMVGLALAVLALAGPTARAQQIPTGYQEYFVLGHEQQVWNLLDRVIDGESAAYTPGNGNNSVVSAVASADGQWIYYDHWEDGLEADILNPVQATTWILGDADTNNGDACQWTTSACAGDVITQGLEITLDSDQGLPGLGPGCALAGTPAQIRCSVPLNPRCPAPPLPTDPLWMGCRAANNQDVRFDGGDRIVSSGGPVSFVHNQDPKCAAGCGAGVYDMTIIGGATEVLSKQAFQNATSYSVPIGQDLYGGAGSPTQPFRYAALELLAFEDDTSVVVTSPGSATLSFTLNRGEHFTSCDTYNGAVARRPCTSGQIDGPTRSVNVTPAITINSGTKVSTSAPISGLMFAAGDGTFATHFMPLLPDLLHATDYLIPTVGDYSGPAPFPYSQGDNRPTNHYLFNPDPANGVVVRWTDSLGTGTVTIAPNSTVNYCTATGRGLPDCVPEDSTVRLTSDRRFWGVTIHDHTGVISDWSYAWLGTRFLSPAYTAAFSPGTRSAADCDTGGGNPANPPCNSWNRAPVWVAATQDNTHVRVDFDGDGRPDFVDTDGDGCPNASTNTAPTDAACEYTAVGTCPVPAAGRCVYEVDAAPTGGSGIPRALRVYDYADATLPYANTGTRIRANKPVAVAYGQETDQGQTSDPTPDTGYVIYPALQGFLDPVFTLDKDVDRTTVPTSGGVATYTLTLRTHDFGPLTSVTASDILPPQVALADDPYVAGSTLVTYPNLTQSTAEPTVDTTTVNGQTRVRLTWDLRTSPPAPYEMGANETLTIRYRVNLPPAPSGTPRQLTNEGRASATYGGSLFNPTDTADVVQTDAVLFKASSDDGSPQPGDLVTYTLYVRNLGVVDELNTIVTDAVPADTTFVTGSITDEGPFAGSGAYLGASNSVRWGGANGVTLGAGAGVPRAVTLAFSGAVATATTAVAHDWASEVPVTISGAGAPYDGTFTITATGPTTFTYVMGATPASPSSGTATGPYRLSFQARINPGVADGTVIPNRGGYESARTPYFLSNEARPVVVGPDLEISKTSEPETVRTLTGLVQAGGTATATTAVAHGWITGEPVTIAGATPAAYDGTFAVTVTGPTTFTYAVPSLTASPASGTIIATGPTVRTHPGEVLTFHVRVRNTGAGAASNVRIDDVIPANTAYVAGSMAYSLNSAAYTPLTDAGDLDQGTVPAAVGVTSITRAGGTATATTGAAHGFSSGQLVQIAGATVAAYNGTFVITVTGANTFTYAVPATTTTPAGGTITATRPRFVLPVLGPREDVDFRFQVRVNAGTDGLVVNNQATVGSTELPPRDTNLVSIPIVGTVTVNGHVWLDLDGNGADPGAGEPDIANVTVRVTDSNGDVQLVTTDASGNWSAVVPAGTVTANVDETDPDFPPQATETTAVDGTPHAAPFTWNVGYRQPALVVTKRSSAGGTVFPGQRVAYTVTVTNTTGVAQTAVNLADLLPPGTTYVPGTAGVVSATNLAIRVREIHLDNVAPDSCTQGGTDYAGTVCTLTLGAPNLAPDYFVIVQGSDLNGATDTTPAQDGASLVADPFGTGDLNAVAGQQIQLTRGGDSTNWSGVVTIVECIAASCATDPNGFRLLDVRRVAHGAGALSGTATSPVPWTALDQVMLVGGANGAGCNSASTTVLEHQACHPRLWPTGADTINWTRDAAGAPGGLDAATSTVMVVQWGSAWNVQRRSITGGNAGGDGLDATGEYSTAGIGPVPRAQTWVWGTGHTNDPNTGSSAEAVALTLGNGVAMNPTESRLAAGIDEPGNAVSIDVYALTHPQLAVDHRFLNEGNAGTSPANVTVTAATTATARMALVYNGLDDQTNDYPAPLAFARYSSNTNVEVLRRRPAPPFAAWVQGIDFSRVRAHDRTCADTPATCYTPVAAGPSNVILGAGAGANGVTIPAGQTLTFAYQVTVDDPLAPAVSSVTNTATVTTTQFPSPPAPWQSASVTDAVLRLGVDVEPNNTVFALFGTTQVFTHDIVNTGGLPDSYDLAFRNDRGWVVELLDDATGAVIAADLDGNGAWDCNCAINTGTLAPGAATTYRLRVAVPVSAAAGSEGTTTLVATSTTNANVWNDVRDEIRVINETPTGPVGLLPDNSGVVTADSDVVYAHRVFNYTGNADTFDLRADSSLGFVGWTASFHWDANGDGIYTPATDLPVTNTRQLAHGESQLLFVVVHAPAGATPNTVDVTHLTAISRANPELFDAATDTTTVVSATSHDLSGGGTRLADPGDLVNHPGTIVNLSQVATDRYELYLTESSLFGLDPLLHPTALHVDKDGDGLIEPPPALGGDPAHPENTPVAVDADGDGDWDTIDPAYNLGPDPLAPDVAVAEGATLAYELRRQVDVDQEIAREHVTLTAVSSSSQSDSVTATVILAAATRASLAGLRVDPEGVVELATVLQQGTMAFNLYETDDPSGRGVLHPLTDAPVVSAFRDAGIPILYRAETAPLTRRYVVVEELEVGGGRRFMGPFPAGDPVMAGALARLAARLDRAGVPAGSLRALTPASSRKLARRQAVDRRRASAAADGAGGSPASRRLPARGVRVEVAREGLVEVPVAALLGQGLPASPAGFLVWNQGDPVPAAVRPGTSGEPVLAFEARALSTDYTGRNAYLVTSGSRPYPMAVPLTRSGPAPTPGTVTVEKSVVYLAQAPLGTDPWLWDYLVPDWGEWPYSWWDAEAGTFDLPRLVPGTSGEVPLRIRFLGVSNDAHRFEARLNGQPLGEVTLDGPGVATLSGTVMAEALLATGNHLTLTYSATDPSTGEPNGWASAYLDALELDLPVLGPPAPSSVVGLEPWDPGLPPLDGVQYLVVTHRRFEASARAVADLKEAEGLKAAVVVVDRAYDRFSGGVVEAEAVRALLRHARVASRGRLRFVLLVGDDTFDTHDHAGTGAVAFVPSLVAWDGQFGRVPSENRYADLDGDGAPDLAIGRLPVETVEQAEALVAKIAGQAEALAASAGRHLFVSDDSAEGDAPFRDQAAAVEATLPEASSVLPSADASAGIEAAREALRRGWEVGASVTHYFGHGGTTTWADEQLLSVDTVDAVAGGARPTVLLTWACLSQLYQYLWGPSINEALLLLPQGGAVASFGPAGITSPAAQQPLIDAVYRHLRPGVALGEALRRAKSEALAENPRSATVVFGFNLLGDPALRVP
jgi:uncharacterized repeat protein (TIGR01451 family)